MESNKKNNPEEFYANLLDKLKKQHKFPIVYMFKFIVPNDNQRLAMVESLFQGEAQMVTRTSKNGKYIAVTGKEMMITAESVIEKYRKAEKIPGIVSL